MSEAVRLQDPAETQDHTLDWATWLGASDTIASSSWAISPTGPDITSTAASHTTTTATVWLAGVTLGAIYELRNTIVTAEARTALRSITVRGWKE